MHRRCRGPVIIMVCYFFRVQSPSGMVNPHGAFTGVWLDDVSDPVTLPGPSGDSLEGATK
jgi:hypothetical protein